MPVGDAWKRRSVKIRISSNARVDRSRIPQLLKKDRRLLIDRGDREVLVFTPGDTGDEKKLVELKKLLQQLT
ncbi:MAG TPA: hypothetical protein PKY31_11080, partial [Spirochaetota bacterium]|nr:hypothetical protein [Spirochaetota bacterium]